MIDAVLNFRMWFVLNTLPLFLLLVLAWVIYKLYKKARELFLLPEGLLIKILLVIVIVILVFIWFLGLLFGIELGFVTWAFGGYGLTKLGWKIYLPLILVVIISLLTWCWVRWGKSRIPHNKVMTILARLVIFMFIACIISALILALIGITAIFYPPRPW